MNPFALVIVILLCAILAVLVSKCRKAWRHADAVWPFHARKPLASPEHVLYQRLVAVLPDHVVMSHVRVTDVLGVKRGFDFDVWNKRIGRLHYDFVVCAKDATVLAAIELDDPAKSKRGDSGADAVKARASEAAGVQLIRWQAKALPDRAAIRAAFVEPEMPLLQEPAASANQSWWPPMPGSVGNSPRA